MKDYQLQGEVTRYKVYKITFNEEKSKVMLVSRRKRKDARSLNVYLNNKKLEQVPTMKYLVIIRDQKFKFKEHIT